MVKELTRQGNLIYHEGPLLSHYTLNNDDYLVSWCDNSKTYNVWLIFKVTKEHLLDYFNNKIDLLKLHELSDDMTIEHLDVNLDVIKSYKTDFKSIDKDYLPEKGCYYNSKDYETYAEQLKHELKTI